MGEEHRSDSETWFIEHFLSPFDQRNKAFTFSRVYESITECNSNDSRRLRFEKSKYTYISP